MIAFLCRCLVLFTWLVTYHWLGFEVTAVSLLTLILIKDDFK